MGQAYPSERCDHCGTLKVAGGKGPRELRCAECDQIDPIKQPVVTRWIKGELRPPK